MIRCTCLLVVVSLAFCVDSLAQPARLWKRDGPTPGMRVEGVQRSTGYVYTSAANRLYLWDTVADTVVHRVVFNAPWFSDIEFVQLIDDSTVLAGRINGFFAHYSINDGRELVQKPWALRMEWIDDSARVAIGWFTSYDTMFVVLSNPRAFEKTVQAIWTHGLKYPTAYDKQRGLIYVRSSKEIIAVDSLGNAKSIAGFDVAYEVLMDVKLLADGTLLAFLHKTYPDKVSRVVAIDRDSYVRTDSITIPGHNYANASGNLFVLPNQDVIVLASSDTVQIIRTNPLQLRYSFASSVEPSSLYISADAAVYYSTRVDGLMHLDSETATLTNLVGARSFVGSATQLADKRIVIGQKGIAPVVIDVRNGNDVERLWNTQSPLKGFDTYDYTVLAATHAPVIAVGLSDSVRLVNTNDAATLCTIRAISGITEGRIGALSPVWLNDVGTEMISQFEFEAWVHSGDGEGVGFSRTSSPCVDNRLWIGGNATFVKAQKYSLVVRQFSASGSGDNALLSAYEQYDPAVHLYTGINSAWPHIASHRIFPGASFGVLLNNGIHGALDHEDGLAIISAVDTLLFRTIPLGTRHLPLSMLHNNDHVITYADGAVHCIDVVGGVRLWSMPVASQPFHILVDRDDRWFLCLYADDYCEMFALDTTVSVGAGASNTLELLVHPNPASETLNIRAPFQMHTCSIYDVLGKVVLTSSLKEPSEMHSLNVEALPTGMYVFSATAGERRATTLVHKQ